MSEQTVHDHVQIVYAELVYVDEMVRTQLGGAILNLSHATLVEPPDPGSEFSSHTRTDPAGYTSEQAHTHDMIGTLMKEVSGYLAGAHKVVVDRKAQDGPDNYGEYIGDRYDLYAVAKSMALGRAKECHKGGDEESTVNQLQTMFALSVIGDPGHKDDYSADREIRDAVAHGMGREVVTSLQHMHGVIALKRHRWPSSVAEQAKHTQLLLKVATGMDFDDQFQHVQTIGDVSGIEGDPDQELRNQLLSSDLIALAQMERATEGGQEKAATLATEAVKKLAKEQYYQHDRGEIADIITTALQVCGTTDQRAKLEDAFKDVRDRRAAGMNRRYRQNDVMRMKLDDAMVDLAVQGNRDGVMQLVSSSPQEANDPSEFNPEDPFNDIIGFPLSCLPTHISDGEKTAARQMLYDCHIEKAGQLRRTLAEAGAEPETIERLICNTPNPDSAADMPSDFWEIYKHYGQHASNQGSNVLPEMAEYFLGDKVYRLDKAAKTVCDLAQFGVSPEYVTPFLLQKISGCEGLKGEVLGIDEVVEAIRSAGLLLVPEGTSQNRISKARDVIRDICCFTEPLRAVQIASELYGQDVTEQFSLFKELFTQGALFTTARLDAGIVEALQDVKTVAYGGNMLLRDSDVLQTVLASRKDGELKNLFATVQASDTLKILIDFAGPGAVYKKMMKTPSGVSELAQIFDGERGIELKALLQDYVSHDEASVIASLVVTNEDSLQMAANVADFYSRLDFLQKPGIARTINFASHFRLWEEFMATIPEGEQGSAQRKMLIGRLGLPMRSALVNGTFAEDPVQAIRVFSEVAPTGSQQRTELLDRLQRHLLQGLIGLDGDDFKIHSGKFTLPNGQNIRVVNLFSDPNLKEAFTDLCSAKLRGDHERLETLKAYYGGAVQELTGTVSEAIVSLHQKEDFFKREPSAAKRWLSTYASQPIKALKLIEAWKARGLALERGIKDNPKDILGFVAEHGVLLYADQAIKSSRTDVTLDEVQSLSGVYKHIGARYAPQTTLKAIERLIHFRRTKGQLPDKIMQQGLARIRVGAEEFNAEVFDKNDPRGFTIGYDTGCCMTLQGASETCIWAGYEDERYSFFGVYDSKGRLRAQSILYIAVADEKKILVADNIEVNRGTNFSPIIEVYREGLLQIARAQELEFDAIQIGTGYVAHKLIGSLPNAAINYQTPLKGTYTDARNQKVIWRRT